VAQFDSSAIAAHDCEFRQNECAARKPLYFRGFMAQFEST